MQPNYISQEPAFELDWLDRKAVQKLYGKAVVSEILLRAHRGNVVSQSVTGPHSLLTRRLAPKSTKQHNPNGH